MKTKFPAVAAVRSALYREFRYLRGFRREELVGPGEDFAGTDIRLQCCLNGTWRLHTGPSDYDQDHRGYWGASFLSYDRQNLTDLARDLLDQAKEAEAEAQHI